ncbi:hypothetical protein R1flu_024407 [Riccia fluitans]|uniref:Steroid 5-alpha reductase C-terminal domain-containing protein n=1 Tax=Riccia fluitans TaxID=41844 RepID=A0ABD1XV85_9MARC
MPLARLSTRTMANLPTPNAYGCSYVRNLIRGFPTTDTEVVGRPVTWWKTTAASSRRKYLYSSPTCPSPRFLSERSSREQIVRPFVNKCAGARVFDAGRRLLSVNTRRKKQRSVVARMGTESLQTSYLGITALVTAIYQFSFFVIAAGFKIDKVTDFAGTTNFVVLAVLTLLLNGTYHYRQLVLTTFVILWGLRLALFLLFRILSWGEDKRFDDKRDNLIRFAVFWILQAVWVWTVSLPVTVLNGSGKNPEFGPRDYVGWGMWAVGMIIEAVADQSKLNFKNAPQNTGRWCDAGLWSWSRHPNYFGEMLLWWGVFLATTPVLSGGQWGVIASPLLLCALLLFLSGIPILESSSDKRHRNNPEYVRYKKTTSPLIPLPPALYGSLPLWVKKTFLFEFPFYSRKLSAGNQVKSS